MQQNLLIIFVKNKIEGQYKTRLVESIGQQRTFEVYTKLLNHTATMASEVDANKWVFYHDHVDEEDEFTQDTFRKLVQANGDLGQRMANAFQKGFQNDFKKVVIVGSDCAEIKPEDIQQAFDVLDTKPLVVGPASDGGYYLLGMTAFHESLFERQPWSTRKLLEKTLETARNHGLDFGLLPPLNDIDDINDLKNSHLWQQ